MDIDHTSVRLPRRRFRFCVTAMAVLVTVPAGAQDTTATRIAPVRVTITRDAARSTYDLPFALSRLTVDSTRGSTRRASFTEMLLFVPGVAAFNRFNPSQDPRLSIRGFGARSAFGIRGVRVLRDGIPLTQADGQTAVDYVDLETIGAAEVIRGSAGALYGNSSGGVVDFRTPAPPDSGALARAHAFYTDAGSRASLYGGGTAGPLGLQGTVTRNEGDGARQYAHYRNTGGFGDARWTTWGTNFQTQFTRYDSPLAENPGALTAAEMDSDRTLADPTQIRKKSSKTVRQSLATLQAAHDGSHGSFGVNLQAGTRALDNPQSFAIVAFDRHTFGGSAHAQYNITPGAWRVRLAAGTDWLSQSDERDNWTNCAGITGTRPATCPGTADKGTVTVDQRERVEGTGTYVRAELLPVRQVSLTATVRDDRTRYSVLDHRLTNPTQQSRSMSAVTPMFGVNWRVTSLASLYANVSSSFETPTTTELANQPDGSTGLNRTLEPQHGRTYEAGAKGIWWGQLGYDAAIFRVTTTGDLISFQIPNGAGRTFFRNAGRTLRRGAELGLAESRGRATVGLTSAWLRYTYEDFVVNGTSYNGRRVPGVAPTTWSAYGTVRPRWGLASVELQHVARLPTDDPNVHYADAYTLVNARAALDIGRRFGAEPVVGVDNLFDRTYAANVVTNASALRYFEPGPGRTMYFGLTLMGKTQR